MGRKLDGENLIGEAQKCPCVAHGLQYMLFFLFFCFLNSNFNNHMIFVLSLFLFFFFSFAFLGFNNLVKCFFCSHSFFFFFGLDMIFLFIKFG